MSTLFSPNTLLKSLILFIYLFMIVNCETEEWNKGDLPTEISDEDSFSARSNDTRNVEKNNPVRASFYGTDFLEQFQNSKTKEDADLKNVNFTKMGRSSRKYYDDDTEQEKKVDGNENYDQEARIMNINDGDELSFDRKKMTIQGYIPIVGLNEDSKKKKQRQFSEFSNQQANSQKYSPYHLSYSTNYQPNYSPNYPSVLNTYPANSNTYPENLNNYLNSYLNSQYPNVQNQHVDQNKQKTRFGSTLQNLASSLTGSVNKLTKRKQTVDYSSFAQDCICVPFYMCRSGYMEQNSKNIPYGSNTFLMSQYNSDNEQALFEKNLQEAQAELSKYYTVPQIEEFMKTVQHERSFVNKETEVLDSRSSSNKQAQESQQSYSKLNLDASSNSDSDLELPINERSIDGRQTTHFTQNDTDFQALSRMFGLSNSFSNKNDGSSCGVLRTCCPLLSPKDISNAQKTLLQDNIRLDYKNNANINLPNNLPLPIVQYNPYVSNPSANSYYPKILNAQRLPNRNAPLRNYAKSIDLVNPYNNLYEQPKKYEKHYSTLNSLKKRYCGTRPETNNQARVQNLNYPTSSAEFGEYPWQAALLKRLGPQDSLFVCGGTLISESWVATAAHCIKKNTALDLKIRLGEWDVHRDDEFYPYVEKLVVQVIKHPNFNSGTLENDIALIQLESSVNLANNPHIMPACIPFYGENFATKKCWVAGWGKDSFGYQGEYQSVLKEVDLPIVDHALCEAALRRSKLGPSYSLHAGFMCAGGERGKDACEGDGGSALVCNVSGVWKVAGLVSWGIGCGKQGLPGVYANVGYYSNWINDIIDTYDTRAEILPEPSSKSTNRKLSEELNSENIFTINNDNNKVYEPASIINERSNSFLINGTESDELTLTSSTQAPSTQKTNNQ